MLQPIDRSLVEKIYTLVGEGLWKQLMKWKDMHLHYYVKNDHFAGQNPPPITKRHYHPKDADIRNRMYKTTVLKQMLCKVDQINFEQKIKTWKQEDPENHFFLRPCSLSPTQCVSENWSNPDRHVEAQIIQNLCISNSLAEALDQQISKWNPVTEAYDQQKMHPHYVRYLDLEEMVPFPKTSQWVPYHVTKNMTSVVIFCVCRMPNDRKEYVQCFQYNGWHHPTCVSIPDWVINSNRRWSVTPAGERRVKDIICISAMMKSCYFTTTLNSTPQNLARPLKFNCTYVWIHYYYVTVSSDGHGSLLNCGQLLGVSLGLNFLFTLSKIIWKIMKWNDKHKAVF